MDALELPGRRCGVVRSKLTTPHAEITGTYWQAGVNTRLPKAHDELARRGGRARGLLRESYFVSDLATNQSLSQTVGPLLAGTYQIGFSAYAPANGYANFYDATFQGVIATVELANYAVSTGPVTTWQTFASSGLNLAAGQLHRGVCLQYCW